LLHCEKAINKIILKNIYRLCIENIYATEGSCMSLFVKDIGIDLGTANTLIYMRGKGIIINEPSVVAVNKRTERAKFVGQEAKEVIGRTPGSIVAVRPLKDGVIADFDVATTMLQEFIKKALKTTGIPFVKARVIICIPSGVTTVEKRAVRESTENAGAKQVHIIEEPMAAAIGAGLPVNEPSGSMIVDIGGGTSEIAVISLGGIVATKSLRCAGDEFDNSIMQYIKKKYNLLIGERTAENIKIDIGTAFPLGEDQTMEIKGRSLMNGLPENITITSAEIRDALAEPLSRVVESIKETLEKTPPELSADIIDHGITLAGGGALLKGLDKLINDQTGMPVNIADEPLNCVVNGTGKIIEDLDNYNDLFAEDTRDYD
jgi:rod shape-determining protein MreB